MLKESEKASKTKLHLMELQNVELREKCKYLEMRHLDFSEMIQPEIRKDQPRTPTVTKKVINKELLQ